MEGTQTELEKLKEENERLRARVAELEAPSGRTPFQDRMAISDIVGRSDAGVGLIGRSVVVAGWVKSARVQGGGDFAFVHVSDGSSGGKLQIVIDGDKGCDLKEVTTGSSICVHGRLVKPKGGKEKVELYALKVTIVGKCDPAVYPLPKKAHTVEYLRTIGHLRPRTDLISAVSRVRNALAFATHKFFQEQGYLYVHTPIITCSDCEGAGEMFQVSTMLGEANVKDIPVTPDGKIDYSKDFFGRQAFLTVSGQLNAEIYASAFTSVYTFGPTFRAENSNTSRHLAEFWMIEPEIAFADLHDNMDVAEAYVKFCVAYVLETCPLDMAMFGLKSKGLMKALKEVIEKPFRRMTYTEAIDILLKSKKKFEVPVEWGIDLGSEHERFLAENIVKGPLFLTDYPKDIKAFYMRLNEDGKTVAAMDMLVPRIGELMGGSQREERLDVLTSRLDEVGLPHEPYDWYLDLRRYGTTPHSGFGVGFERLVTFTTGVQNIREAIPFPRWPKHADF